MSQAHQANVQPSLYEQGRRVVLAKQSKPSPTPNKDEQPNKNDQNHKEPDPKKTKPEIQKWY
jgi:hypothetical protein